MSVHWETEILPVLEAVHAVIARDPFPVNGAQHTEIDAELGREEWDSNTGLALNRLAAAGYVTKLMEVDNHVGPLAVDLTEKGLQLTAGWPTGAADAFYQSMIAKLDERIAAATDDHERSALERFRDFAVGPRSAHTQHSGECHSG